MIATFPSFTHFEDVSYQEYDKYVGTSESYSDFNYVSIFSWNPAGTCMVSILNGNLVLSLKDYLTGKKLLTFIGQNNVEETVRQLLRFVAQEPGYTKSLELVPAVVAEMLFQPDASYIVEEDIDNNDYLLSAAQYINLEGSQFEQKRKNYNKFTREYGPSATIKVTPLSASSDPDESIRLTAKWSTLGTDGANNAQDEYNAICKILNNAKQLSASTDLQCIQLYIDAKLVGFCIFEIRQSRQAITHFGKSNINYSNSYEYMMIELLRYIYEHYKIDYVNNEQDLGIPGLRANKRSQRPVGYLKKFRISARKTK